MAGARRPEVEEALRPLDGHHMVTGARIVHIDLVEKALRPRQLSRSTSQPPTMLGPNSQGETFYSPNTVARLVGPRCQVEE